MRTAQVLTQRLVAMFLRMSQEERLRANDNAVRAILELRNAIPIGHTWGDEKHPILGSVLSSRIYSEN
jgi:hypothetical protein